jgi:hypothetical protein
MPYRTVNLAINLTGHALNPVEPAECNPGGSTICDTGTKGCGSGGMTCVGTSSKLEMIEMMVSIPPDELGRLQAELVAVLKKFASSGHP